MAPFWLRRCDDQSFEFLGVVNRIRIARQVLDRMVLQRVR